ncbi:uncharacterized protein [Rutidosis leptorrhynchoides]|uniref:uncharacterized protein n=1 Tax=Rutidosis leptorrhynchoides TaxID=125765 RepID=UPI003A98F5C8
MVDNENGSDSGASETSVDGGEEFGSSDDLNYIPHIILPADDKILESEEQPGLNFEEFDSGNELDTVEMRRKLRLKHIRSTNQEDPNLIQLHKFYVGQRFSSSTQVKERVRLHSIETRRDLHLHKNDKVRVRVRCLGLGLNDQNKPNCPWTLLVSKGKNEDTWLVKTLNELHLCQQKRELRQCTSSILSKQIGDTLVVDPDLKAGAIQDIMSKKYELGIKKSTAYRAKAKAKKAIVGYYREQYLRLRDYCLELQKRNPNTTTRIQVHPEPNVNSDSRVFKRAYICLGPLKEGFRACQREILGLDGAFLKGPYTGQLLSAVGVDPNNGTYPLAYAIVEAETTDSWKWFLECIGDDLNLDSRTLASVYPSAEHRFCVRHIYENMRGSYKGGVIKDLVWKCATRTTVEEFDATMDELRREIESAYNYLKDIAPHHWSRAHFTEWKLKSNPLSYCV